MPRKKDPRPKTLGDLDTLIAKHIMEMEPSEEWTPTEDWHDFGQAFERCATKGIYLYLGANPSPLATENEAWIVQWQALVKDPKEEDPYHFSAASTPQLAGVFAMLGAIGVKVE
jgi:hypothetical protein